MNLCKRVLLLSSTLFFIGVTIAKGQANTPVLKDGAPIDQRVMSYVMTHGKAILEGQCMNGCFFVKFTVDSKGTISDIASNEGAWLPLDTLVRSALSTTDGLWDVSKSGITTGKKKTYLLPVLFNAGYCKEIKKGTAAEIMASMPTLDMDNLRATQKGMTYNFLRMTDFQKNAGHVRPPSSAALECVLLSPIYLAPPKI